MNAVGTPSSRPGGMQCLPLVSLTAACTALLGAVLCYLALVLGELNRDDASHLVRTGLFLFLAPLLEEVVFRGGLQEALIRRSVGPWTANIATSLVFVAAHLVGHTDRASLAVFPPSLLLGALYQRNRSVALCALLHAVMNGVGLVLRSTT
jgi:membrane protease YdiL (CAAX protease family)